MIVFNHCQALSLCLIGSVFLTACTRRQRFWVSPTGREIEEVRSRTVPSNGSLLRVSEPVRNESSVRDSWEIQTRSDNQAYFQWLKNQLGPQYHVTSETASAVTFVKEMEETPIRSQSGVAAPQAAAWWRPSLWPPQTSGGPISR